MKVILDIKKSSRIPFFMELVKSLDYISVVKEIKQEKESQFITDLAASFNEVRLFEKGEKKLKSINQLLDEL